MEVTSHYRSGAQAAQAYEYGTGASSTSRVVSSMPASSHPPPAAPLPSRAPRPAAPLPVAPLQVFSHPPLPVVIGIGERVETLRPRN